MDDSDKENINDDTGNDIDDDTNEDIKNYDHTLHPSPSTTSLLESNIENDTSATWQKILEKLFLNINSQRCDFIFDDAQKALFEAKACAYFQPLRQRSSQINDRIFLYGGRGLKNKIQWSEPKYIGNDSESLKIKKYLSKFLNYSPSASNAVSSDQSSSSASKEVPETTKINEN
jgi:hypothetical protein